MLVDGDGLPGIRKAVLDAIAEFGRRGLTCPPVIIGVGIGGTKDQSFSIAARMNRKTGRQVLVTTHSVALLRDPGVDETAVRKLFTRSPA